MPTAPYGSWRSPITADLIVSASIALGQPRFAGDCVYWLESRPTEGGRYVIVRRRPDGSTEDVNPAPLNARTRVHEYGGGDFVVAEDGTVYFSNFADQRLYFALSGGEPAPLTHREGVRYADAVLDPARNRLICVREDHSGGDAGGDVGKNGRSTPLPEAKNTIAAVDLSTGDETTLVEGHDFFAYPRVSPDGGSLCWIAWDHPNMPWDETALAVAGIGADGSLSDERVVAGGSGVSIFQPEWSPDGRLYWVSDETGWWNVWREAYGHTGIRPDGQSGTEATGQRGKEAKEIAGAGQTTGPLQTGGRAEAVVGMEAEFGAPLWQFGESTYGFDGAGRIVCAYCVAGFWRLGRIETATGTLSEIETGYSLVRDVRVRGGRALFFAGSPDAPSGLVSMDVASGACEVVKRSSSIEIDAGTVSRPVGVEFPSGTGARGKKQEARETAFGFFYEPRNKDYAGPAGELPPLIVMSHGGPTAAAAAVLSARVQFWTSRGIAVLDVNYGGSTGYGRAYRERLNGRWGIVDVDDCVAGALYLVERGLVDGGRLAITGGSAGGYTTLAALTFRDVFKAGASHYGIGDLSALASDTHKFESRYLDGLVGPYPERADVYEARSPIHHVAGLSCPAIFFQGLEDQVVPPNQAESMVAALRAKGVPVAYLPFEGEQHGFRRAENIKRSLEAELYFYGR
ncbi:MAG TPA: S9 family peptidase, partial [Dehalococcoidia bacterium]|nr:S9 family peptidase [Dehalococcoidia bacterium]